MMATAVESSPLVDPRDRPDAEVVIFDGHCRFCSAQVQRLARWDRRDRLAFLSLHDPRVAELYPELTHEQLMENMYLVDRNGDYHFGAAAFRVLSRRLPILWPIAPILNLPGTLPIWQWGYQQIARRRYRLGQTCDDGQCKI